MFDFDQLFEILKFLKEILEVIVLLWSGKNCFKEVKQEYPELKENLNGKYQQIKEKIRDFFSRGR